MNVLRCVTRIRLLVALFMLLGVGQSTQAAVVAYEDVSFISGTGFQSDVFTISSSGSYLATLTDFDFPAPFSADFMLIVSTSTTELGRVDGPGSFTFQATPGTYWASIYAVASEPLNLGLFGVRVEQLGEHVSAVPVPGALYLFASAVLVGTGFARKRTR